jgi:hypothetical protein
MQRVVNTRIKEEVFSMWFAYIHCWAKDVFSMDPPRGYVSSPVVNQKTVVEENENGASSQQSRKKGSAEDCDCD